MYTCHCLQLGAYIYINIYRCLIENITFHTCEYMRWLKKFATKINNNGNLPAYIHNCTNIITAPL